MTHSVKHPSVDYKRSISTEKSGNSNPQTLAEIRRGILEKPKGKKRRQLESWFSGPEGPEKLFAGRVLPFDETAALAWAKLMAEGTARGQPRSALDMIIAAIAEANDCVLVTDNEKHLAGLKVFNPLRVQP